MDFCPSVNVTQTAPYRKFCRSNDYTFLFGKLQHICLLQGLDDVKHLAFKSLWKRRYYSYSNVLKKFI